MNRKISFNTAAHNNEVKEIKNKFENFKELLTLSEAITEGKLITPDQRELDKYLTEKWGFPNIQTAANLHNYGSEYSYYVATHKAIEDYREYYHQIEGTTAEIKDEALEALKERYTNRMKDSQEEHYTVLEDAIRVLNEALKGLPYQYHKSILMTNKEAKIDLRAFLYSHDSQKRYAQKSTH